MGIFVDVLTSPFSVRDETETSFQVPTRPLLDWAIPTDGKAAAHAHTAISHIFMFSSFLGPKTSHQRDHKVSSICVSTSRMAAYHRLRDVESIA